MTKGDIFDKLCNVEVSLEESLSFLRVLKADITNMVKNNKITFDVMVDGGNTFYRTFHMPITLDMISGYDGDKPVIDADKIEEHVLKKCPTLKHEKFRICF